MNHHHIGRRTIAIALRLIVVSSVLGTLCPRDIALAVQSVVPAEVYQQGGETLVEDTPVSGILDDVLYRQVYIINGRAGDVIQITMSRVSGDLDPVAYLIDEQGDILAMSDDDGDGSDAQIGYQRFVTDGRYFVVATRFGQEHGSTTGEYMLLLNRVGGGGSGMGTTLEYGDNVLGLINRNMPRAFYFIRAERGDVINIVMRRTSGSLDPRLDLATADGVVLVSNDDDPNSEGTLDAAIHRYLVLEGGTYILVATRFGDLAGNTQGTYSLDVSKLPPEELGSSPEEARLADYGMTYEGAISDEAYARYFRFDARRGDVVTATITVQTGNLDPLVKIIDSNMEELAADNENGEGYDARIAAFTLPAAGTYYLAVTRNGEENGQSEGAFLLYLSGRPGIMGGRALELSYGAVVSGQINDQVTGEEYVFFGSEGDVIKVAMERASGDLDSLVTLLDSERKQIAFDDDSGSSAEKNAAIDRFTLPRDGIYYIVASRYERETGQTQGAYILTLELLQADS